MEELKDLPRKIALFLGMILFLILAGTIGFKIILHIPLSSAFVTTMESFALLYHAESGAAKIFGISITLFGVILFWWILWSLFDIISEGSVREYLKVSNFLNRIQKMREHYIIAGGGRVGEVIAENISKQKKGYVIIEKEESVILKLKKQGIFVMHGDVTDENVLKQARIKEAKAIILAMPETEKNLLVTMIARELNPQIEIYARADKPAFVSKLKKAGARVVIVPEMVAAEKFLNELK